MNRKTIIPAALALCFSVLAAVGVKTFLGPCVHEDGTFGPCHWAGQALFGISLLLTAQGIGLLAARKNTQLCRGLFLAMVLTSVLGMLIPGPVISLCGMATMRCRALMRPAMTILMGLTGLFSLTGFFLSGEAPASGSRSDS